MQVDEPSRAPLVLDAGAGEVTGVANLLTTLPDLHRVLIEVDLGNAGGRAIPGASCAGCRGW